MHKHDLNELIEFDDRRFHPKVLLSEPGYRMVLLSMRAGQSSPEHAAPGILTIHAILGWITLFTESLPCELRAGQVVCIDTGVPLRLEAHEDSALLVLITGATEFSAERSEDLDLREIPRPQRHPLVFQRFDGLSAGSSFTLTNDHDPVPLKRQMETMLPGQVEWGYMKRGPDTFRIRIRKLSPPQTPPNSEADNPLA
jgi:uncharacterized protein (DUF2249 family)